MQVIQVISEEVPSGVCTACAQAVHVYMYVCVAVAQGMQPLDTSGSEIHKGPLKPTAPQSHKAAPPANLPTEICIQNRGMGRTRDEAEKGEKRGMREEKKQEKK